MSTASLKLSKHIRRYSQDFVLRLHNLMGNQLWLTTEAINIASFFCAHISSIFSKSPNYTTLGLKNLDNFGYVNWDYQKTKNNENWISINPNELPVTLPLHFLGQPVTVALVPWTQFSPAVVGNISSKFLIYHHVCTKVTTFKPPTQPILVMSFYFLIKVQSALNIQRKHICLFLS